MFQGDLHTINVTITDTGRPDGQADDITGATAEYTVADDSSGSLVTVAGFPKTSPLGGITFPGGGGDGKLTIQIDPGDTLGLAIREEGYWHQCRVNLGVGPETVFTGRLYIEAVAT